MKIAVKAPDSALYYLSKDNEWLCAHEDTYIERACCNGRDCGCYGLDSVYCNNPACTGISDVEVQAILEASEPDYDDYNDYDDWEPNYDM